MAGKNYTITESIEALGVDPKTFRRWLEKANIDPDKQRSTIDERMRYLTEAQLSGLAQAHGRPWPPQPRAPKDQLPTSPGAFKQLVSNLISPVEQEQSEQAEQIQDHSRLLAEALGRTERHERTIYSQQEHINNLEHQLNDQATQIAHLLEQIQAMNRPRARRPKGTTEAAESGEVADHAGIPELAIGLVGAAEFAVEHGINPGTAKSAFQTGRVPTRRGKWRAAPGRNPITVALDAEGQRVFWQVYHSSASFQACQDCPHDQAGNV